MSIDDSPVCARHEGDVAMRLRSMHSDNIAPDQLLGLFECPECGHERRLPIDLRTEVA
jgi:predicted RNA-binding Zn-ribbon protein involved in translation (DUF1610 family)